MAEAGGVMNGSGRRTRRRERRYAVNEGQRFGMLRAERQVDSSSLVDKPTNGVYVWFCLCDCGGTMMVRSDDLAAGTVTRCNACAAGQPYDEPRLYDMTGETVGELTVLEMLPSVLLEGSRRFWQPYYLVRCSCGRKFRTRQQVLVEGWRTACNVCDPK